MEYDTMHLKIMQWIFPDEQNMSSFRHPALTLCGIFSVTDSPACPAVSDSDVRHSASEWYTQAAKRIANIRFHPATDLFSLIG